jgi:hypothetical protein
LKEPRPSSPLSVFPCPTITANIMVGEIAIRHLLKGENSLFISEQFDPEFTVHYVFELFRNQRVRCCLSGWVEGYGDHYESFLFIVEQKNNIEQLKKPLEYIIFNPLSVKKLFKGNSKSWKR